MNRKKRGYTFKVSILCITACIITSLLSSCSSGQSQINPLPQKNTIQQAAIEHPELAVEPLPIDHLTVTKHSTVGNTILQFKTDQLENLYETLFCQLNSDHNVTMQSSECQANISYIASESDTGYFNLNNKPILNNSLGITNIDFESVTYYTKVQLLNKNQPFLVSGGLLMPEIESARIKGVIVYFHATTFNKNSVGSNFNNMELKLNAALFASQGYIVVLPDYVGLGVDWQNVHPYAIYPVVNVKTAIDMLNAISPIIITQYHLNNATQFKLFSAGYSEGAAYSLWFNLYLRQNPDLLNNTFYKLTHSVGMEGAYNLFPVMSDYLFGNVGRESGNLFNIQDNVITNLSKAALSGDVLLSYATYTTNANYSMVFNNEFYEMNCLIQKQCDVNNNHVNLLSAFNMPNTNIAKQTVFSALNKTSNNITYPSSINVIYSSQNSISSLTSNYLVESGYQLLKQTLTAANVNLSQMPNNIVSIITLSEDSVVTPNNYYFLLEHYPDAIAIAKAINPDNIVVVSPFSYYTQSNKPIYVPVDHVQGLTYEFLYALNIFNTYSQNTH